MLKEERVLSLKEEGRDEREMGKRVEEDGGDWW
jgi:hypothetical protein